MTTVAELQGLLLNLLSQVAPIAPVQTGLVLTQLLAALVIGLITAFAFQFLLTSFGIAIGLSAWGMRAARSRSVEQPEPNHQSDPSVLSEANPSEGNSAIGTIAGLGILLTVNVVLFAACFLAAKFSQVDRPWFGAIEGIVIWSAYFLLLIWLSTTAVSSFVGTLFDATTGGLRRMITAIAAAFSNQDEPVTEAQMIATIREEMQAAFNSDKLRQLIAVELPPRQPNSLSELPLSPADSSTEDPATTKNGEPPAVVEFWQKIAVFLGDTSANRLTNKRIDRKLHKFLEQAKLDLAEEDLPAFDRAVLSQLLEQRQDLKSRQKERILDQFAETWQQTLEELPSSTDTSNPSSQSPEQSRSLAEKTADLWQSARDVAVDRVLETLPSTIQQINATLPTEALVPLAVSLIKNKIQDAIESDHTTDDSNFTDLSQIVTHVEHWQDRSMQQIEAIQQTAQARITDLKQQAQHRMAETRKTAAAAAWWLFLTASTGAISAALAGAFATGLTFVQRST
ncbi:MAG TPA: hypothetical protein V6D10_06250 [Trichocoleus sp.]|jgi:hypothetical protein